MIPQCVGCGNERPDDSCRVYKYPDRQHTRVGGCSMRTHDRIRVAEERGFIDPLKASKQAAKAKIKAAKQAVTPDKKRKKERRDAR